MRRASRPHKELQVSSVELGMEKTLQWDLMSCILTQLLSQPPVGLRTSYLLPWASAGSSNTGGKGSGRELNPTRPRALPDLRFCDTVENPGYQPLEAVGNWSRKPCPLPRSLEFRDGGMEMSCLHREGTEKGGHLGHDMLNLAPDKRQGLLPE